MPDNDVSVTATFTSLTFEITWLNDDDSVINTTMVEYGKTPTHADASKPATAEYTYTFAGWTPEVAAVTGDATYKAMFTATKNSYTITWLNDDDSLIDTTTVEYGKTPTHAEASKPATAEYTYAFKGWTPELAAVTGDATYKATYTATKNKYTVIFMDNGTEYEKVENVDYGTRVEKPADPVRETFSFIKWTAVAPEPDGTWAEDPEEFSFDTPITGNLTLYAVQLNTVTFSAELATDSSIDLYIFCKLADGLDPADYDVQMEYESKYQKVDGEIRPMSALRNWAGYGYLAEPTTVPGKKTNCSLQIGSDEMTYKMKVTILKKNGEVVDSKAYSISDIVEEKIQTPSENERYGEYLAMLKAMLQYGYYAQHTWQTHLDVLPNIYEGTPAMVDNIPDDYAPQDSGNALAGYIKNVQFGLRFDAAIDLDVRITPEAGCGIDDFDIEVICSDGNMVPTTPTVVGGQIRFVVQRIYADQMADDVQVKITLKSDPSKTATWTRSLTSCAYGMQDGRYADVSKAMYVYSEAAAVYWKGK